MTFVEELKQISIVVELKHKLDRELHEIKTKMKIAAEAGYHYFTIEIYTIKPKAIPVIQTQAKETDFRIYTANSNLYESRIIDFLYELGFDSSEITITENSSSYYESTNIKVYW